MSSRHLAAVPASGSMPTRERERVVQTIRLYETARAVIADDLAPVDVLTRIGREVGTELWVCADDALVSAFPPHGALPDVLAREFRRARQASGEEVRGLVRLAVPGREALVVPLDTRRPMSLIALPTAGAAPSFALLQHAATLVGLALERVWARSADRRRHGADVLDRLLDRVPTSELQYMDGDGPFLVIALANGTWDGIEWLHDALGERGIPNLLTARAGVVYGLLPASDHAMEQLPEIFAGAVVGVSSACRGTSSVVSAARQAHAALDGDARGADGLRWFDELRSSFVPGGVTDPHAIAESVLGPLIAYDEKQGTELLRSLAAFLECDRSWQRTAEVLCVHKQTLVYRLRRVEELTGRRLRATDSVANFWFALKAYGEPRVY